MSDSLIDIMISERSEMAKKTMDYLKLLIHFLHLFQIQQLEDITIPMEKPCLEHFKKT